MNNHYHLLLKTPNCDISRFMYFFNKTISEKIRKKTGQINKMFGGRFKASAIKDQNHLCNVYRYIYQNPIRAGICNKCEEYPYSTLGFKISQRKFVIPLYPLFKIDSQFLNICNQTIPTDKVTSITKGLQKSIFKEPSTRNY